VFAGNGNYHSVLGFTNGFSPAIVVSAAFALIGAAAALALPARRRSSASEPVGIEFALEGEAV
jgi:hypothetical protein